MKKLGVLLFAVSIAVVSFGQKGKVTSAVSYKDAGDLKKAIETIELAVDESNPKAVKSLPWPRTWEARGEIYQAAFASGDETLAEKPLFIAYDSYMKVIELDVKKKYEKSLKLKFTFFENDLFNYAGQAYEKKDYATALECFEKVIELHEIPFIKADNPEMNDSIVYYNAGLTAALIQDLDKAIKFYRLSEESGYQGPRCYYEIYNAEITRQDSAAALAAISEGFEKYPSEEIILTTMINHYLLTPGGAEDAIKYLDLAIAEDPTNPTFWFAKGSGLEQMNDLEGALECYNKSIEIDSEFYNGHYNLGVFYFNKAAAAYAASTDIPPSDEAGYKAKVAEAQAYMEKCIPFFLKCKELQPNTVDALQNLGTAYLRLGQKDKYQEITDEINSIK